ncbi:hypothetical protein JOD20_001607 [Herpetosiphon giganteus]|nr:hypothetical protein [Herpetosiphon giganteus]
MSLWRVIGLEARLPTVAGQRQTWTGFPHCAFVSSGTATHHKQVVNCSRDYTGNPELKSKESMKDESKSQKSKVRSQKSEVRSQKKG